MLRHIRHLQVRCASETDAQHGRVLLEDAMRTAALRDEDQLIIVRRLELGGIPARASATEWSRRLEQRFRASHPVAIRFDDPAANGADAVYFPDIHEPWLQVAERVASGRTANEWFWHAALPGWWKGVSAAETLRLAFRRLASAGGLRLTLVLASRLDERRRLLSLLSVLEPADLGLLAGELPGVTEARRHEPGDDVRDVPPLSGEELALVAKWGDRDARTHWLAAVHLARTGGTTAKLAPNTAAAAQRTLAFIRAWRTAIDSGVTSPALPPSPVRQERTPRTYVDEPRRNTPEFIDRESTRLGGLLFAIPLLVRAGLPGFIATLPPVKRELYAWHVLRLLGHHARGPLDDPLMRLTADLPPAPSGASRWVLAAHRIALATTRLPLRKLILRRALVSITSTHVTVSFRLGEADIRIRCAGLDIDPGWVPWLGRVVAFRFDRED